MTDTPTPSADEIWAILRATAVQQQRFQQESNDRFNRLEQQQAATQQQIDSNAKGLAETRAIVDSNAHAIAANSEMLTETRAIVDSNARAISANSEGLAETKAIVDSNARAIVANSEAIAQLRSALREEVASITQMVTDLGEYVGTVNDRLDNLIRLSEQDRAESIALRADVRSLITALRDRFGGNGHAGD